jgi:pyruvate/2-oxoglutarate dehydrogenase complex dihydrolipoamide acyltransferase (E2) component
MLNKIHHLTRKSILSQRILSRCFANKDFNLPLLSESIQSVTITEFLKKEGEYVFEDEEFIQVESHKGDSNIKASFSGLISKYTVEIDQDVNVGEKLCEIDVDAPQPTKSPKAESVPPPPSPSASPQKPVSTPPPTPSPTQKVVQQMSRPISESIHPKYTPY